MKAVTVNDTSTVLQLVDGGTTVPRMFYAKLAWSSAHGTIYCADEGLLLSLSSCPSQAMLKIGSGDEAHVVNDPALASLVLTVKGDAVSLDRNDPDLNAHLPARFPYTLKLQAPLEIQRVIAGWRHFHYHLRRGPGGEDESRHIRMELHYLKPKSGNWKDKNTDYVPDGPSLLTGDSAVHEVKVPKERIGKPLGFRLYNDGDVDVYPYLFYFNPTKLTISESLCTLIYDSLLTAAW